MESPQRLKTMRCYLAGTVCALLAIAYAAPSAAVEGRGAITNSNGLEASRSIDESGLSGLRKTPRRTPSGFLYRHPYEVPSYREWGTWEVRGFLESGFMGDAGEDDEAQFRKYGDWSEGFLLRDFELDLRQKEGLGYLTLDGGAVGRDDQFYRAELGQHGRFRVSGFFDSLAHRYANDALFLLEGVGTDTLTLPPTLVPGGTAAGGTLAAIDAALLNVDRRQIEHERDDYGADVSIRLLPEMRLFASYRNQHHEGLRAFGGTHGFTFNATNDGSVIELLEPLDSRTHHWSAGLSYSGQPVQANLIYRGSVYENDFKSLTWENPFEQLDSNDMPVTGELRGRSALSPDNHSHSVATDISAALPWNGRITASGSFTRFRQNARLLAPTINQNLPLWNDASTALTRSRADAQVDQWMGRAKIRVKPLRILTLQLTGRYFERDNDTNYRADNAAAGFAGYVTQDVVPVGRVGAPSYSYKRWSLASKASLRIASKTRVNLEYQHEETIRENRSRREVRDEKIRLDGTTRAIPHTNLRIAYEYLHRRGSDFDTTRDQEFFADPNNPVMPIGPSQGLINFAQFDLVDRDQHRVDLRANWQLGEVIDLSLAQRYRDGGPDTSYGLTRDRTASLDADASYQPSPIFDLRAFGGFEWRDRSVTSIVGRRPGIAGGDFTAGGDAYRLTHRWSLDSELWSFVAGVGIRYRPMKRLELQLDYTHVRSREELDYEFASPSAVPRAVDQATLRNHFQALHFQDHVLDLQVSYEWADWIETSLLYRLQYSTIDDFQQEDLQPRINQNLLLAHTDDDYTAHVFGILVAFRF